jgi:hypothetical protein
MEYKIKKTFEIIELSPVVLKTNIPIIDIFTYSIYFLGTPIYFFFRTLKTKESFWNLFKSKDKLSFSGPEIKFSTLKNIDGEKVSFDSDEIIKTEIIFHKNKDAFKLFKILMDKGFNLNLNSISSNFIIKEKLEFYNSNTTKPLKEEVLFSSPEFANKIASFLKIKN